MKKKNIITISIIAVIAILIIWFIAMYNGLVERQETAKTQWSNVQAQYQRRADLIPSLVATVKGFANHEESTLTAVVEARAKATSITVDPSKSTPEEISKFLDAQDELHGAINKLLVSVEAYPNLKSDEHFLTLQSQLEGTENRIKNAREDYNNSVKEYNIKIRVFPRNIIARMFGFEPMNTFEAKAGTENAPVVEF